MLNRFPTNSIENYYSKIAILENIELSAKKWAFTNLKILPRNSVY